MGLCWGFGWSLVSGAFSVANAQLAYQASENSANRSQQSSERSIEEENKRKRDEFLRDQRVVFYKQFLADSRLTEDAQIDYYNVLSQPAIYAPAAANAYLTDMEAKNRQFVGSAWGM